MNGSALADQESLYGFKFRIPDKRRVKTGTKSWDIQQLWQRSHEILNLAVLGYKNTEIANILGVHSQTVSNTINSSLGKTEIANKREARDEKFDELYDEVLELTAKAMKVYEEIITSPVIDMKLRKETADTLTLDLAGMRAPTRIDSRNVSTNASMDEIEKFKQRGKDAAKASGKIVDVESLDG